MRQEPTALQPFPHLAWFVVRVPALTAPRTPVRIVVKADWESLGYFPRSHFDL